MRKCGNMTGSALGTSILGQVISGASIRSDVPARGTACPREDRG